MENDFIKNLPEGFLKEDEIDWIYDTICKMPENSLVVELGSWLGRSTCVILKAILDLKINHIQFYAIDSWKPENYCTGFNKNNPKDIFVENINNRFPKNFTDNIFTFVEKDTKDALDIFENNSIDFCFIDACHNYENVKSDINSWYDKMKIGSIFCGHDFYKNDVRRAVFEFSKKNNKRAYLAKKNTSIWRIDI